MQVIGAGDDTRFLMGYIWQNIPQDLGEFIFIQSTIKLFTDWCYSLKWHIDYELVLVVVVH